uniref:Cyclin-D-binding Myb-like transcription factor 1 n=1 Tax=Noccaea caerulescens TaxID=107243 RepID=A0A1J3K0S7_NOCCA
MAEDKKKSKGTVEKVVAEHSSMRKEKKKKKKKEKNRDIEDSFAGEDGEIAAREIEKLGDEAKKKSEKKRVNSEAEDDAKKLKKTNKEKCVDSEADDDRVKKSKKKNEDKKADSEIELAVKKSKKTNEEKRTNSEIDDALNESKKENKEKRADSETEDVVKQLKKKKSKRESGGDEIGISESSKVYEGTDDAKTKTGKRKRDDTDLGAEENTESSNKELKRKSKKKKPSVDSEVEETSLNSAKTKSKEKKQSEDPEVEGNKLNSAKTAKKKRKKKQSQDPEAEDNNSDGTKVAKKKGKKKQSEAEENNNGATKDAKKKRKKQNSSESDKDVPTPSSKSAKKVKFSDQVEVFPAEEKDSDEEEEAEVVELVRGKRFTKEEDELIRKAVSEYIDNHALGEEGLNMILDCKSHPEVKGCWKEITAALPWRAYNGVYNRAHTIFEAGSSKGIWTKEDLELVVEYQKKHGNDWRALADAMGKHRKHVKDAWRRIRLASRNKGHWSREEYQNLFDLVNTDLRMKAFHEKHSKHGMLRDNIPWMAISDQLGTRTHVDSCMKWYDKLMSPMVAEGIWANVDDYRLLDELTSLDAACIDDVDWDTLLENRDGETCRKRWNQMVHHIGLPGTKTFAEQVEILSQRYCPELAEDREDFDNRPFDPED